MDIVGTEGVVFSESYLLGWNYSGDEFVVYMYVLLQMTHPEFEPFDDKSEFGCYKYLRIFFNNVKSVDGLPGKVSLPEWDSKLSEYKDIGEINDAIFIDGVSRIETDELNLVVAAEKLNFKFCVKGCFEEDVSCDSS